MPNLGTWTGLLGLVLLLVLTNASPIDSTGKLVQVEAADKASRRGKRVILGLSSKDGAVLISWARRGGKSLTPLQQLVPLTQYSGIAARGVASDIGYAQNLLFEQASQHSLVYSSPIPTGRLARMLADQMHLRTMQRQFRPLGLRTCIAGYDEDRGCLFEVDVMGNCFECTASCLGSSVEEEDEIIRAVTTATTSTIVAEGQTLATLAKGEEEEENDPLTALAKLGIRAIRKAASAGNELYDDKEAVFEVAVVGRNVPFEIRNVGAR